MFFVRHRKGFTRLMQVLLAVMLFMGSAFAEGSNDPFFAQFDGMDWSYSSGVGGWSTDLQLLPDGSFSGTFHDSEMGDTGENYPDGTMYVASFSGKLSLIGQVNDYIRKIRVEELKETDSSGVETIEDGIRYITTGSYGLTEGDEMLLFRPGTPLDSFTDEMKMWAHVFDAGENQPDTLQDWFLYSEKNDSGFVAFQTGNSVSIANPWETVTADQLRQLSGMYFNVPGDAEKVAYRWFANEKLAEVEFVWMNGEYIFRSLPVAPDNGVLRDISGMYFDWAHEESVSIAGNPGTIGIAQSETGSWVERCVWYDSAMGLTYSLSVVADDVDGLDLAAVAEQITLPAAG